MSKRSPSTPKNKTKKYKTTFQTEWLTEFPNIKRSDKGDGFAFCAFCNSTFGVTVGGRNDITIQNKGSTYIANASSSKIMPKIATLFKATTPDKVTEAEEIFSTFIAEHNIPFAAADHFTSLCQHMFPDSEIARKYACRRTKLTYIINSAVAPSFDAKVTAACKAELDWREFV